MGFSDLVVVHNGGFLLRTKPFGFCYERKSQNDGADRLALGQNLLREYGFMYSIDYRSKAHRHQSSLLQMDQLVDLDGIVFTRMCLHRGGEGARHPLDRA